MNRSVRGVFAHLMRKAHDLKREILVLYFAGRDPRTPWYVKVLVGCVVAYALSPIDLIPDPIPVLGYLDDLLLLPIGIYIAVRLIPQEILSDCRARAAKTQVRLPKDWRAATVILLFWLIVLALSGYFLFEALLAG